MWLWARVVKLEWSGGMGAANTLQVGGGALAAADAADAQQRMLPVHNNGRCQHTTMDAAGREHG